MSLLEPIGPGERREINSDVWNQLVRSTDRAGAPGPFRVLASARYVEVHHADDELRPGVVHVQDTTDWRGYERDRVRLSFELEGVGRLDRQTAGAGEHVEWTWPEAEWGAVIGGLPLPTAVSVVARAEVLTTLTTVPSVEERAHLPAAAADGDRALVRGEGQVYRFDAAAGGGAGDWAEVEGASWVPYGEQRVAVVVARSVDPELYRGLSLGLMPEADTFSLGESGQSRLRVYDHSTFPDDVTSVRRTLSVRWVSSDGTLVEPGAELRVSPASVPNLLATAEAPIVVDVASIGEVELRASYQIAYAHGTETREVTRRVKVSPATLRAVPTAVPPTLPGSVVVRPGNGRTRVQAAVPAVVHGWEATSAPRDVLNVVEPAQQVASALTNRLGRAPIELFRPRTQSTDGAPLNDPAIRRYQTAAAPDDAGATVDGDVARVTVPQAAQLLTAVTTIRNTLTAYTGGVVRSYRVRVAPGPGATADDLLAVHAGQVLYVPSLGAALRVVATPSGTSAVATGDDGSPVQGVLLECEGLLERESHSLFEAFEPQAAHVTGSADLLVVRATYAYGNVDDAAFPAETFVVERLFDPRTGAPVFDQALPAMRPTSLADAWHVRLEVASAFRGLVYEFTETPWALAEVLPGGSPRLVDGDFRGAGRFFESPYRHDGPYDFYGYYEWVADEDHQTEAAPTLDAARALAARRPLAEREAVMISNAWAGKRARLYLRGHFRTKGGTVQREFKTAVTSNAVTVDGAPVTVRPEVPASGPADSPEADGTFLVCADTRRVWMGATVGSSRGWLQISTGGDYPFGWGDPLGDEAYNFAPVITGEEHDLALGRAYELAFVAEDYDGAVESLDVTGVPSFLAVRHEWWDPTGAAGAGEWAEGIAVAARRRVVLSGAAAAEGDYTVRVVASDGQRASTADFAVRAVASDSRGPAIVSARLSGTDTAGQTRELATAHSTTSATVRAEVGMTNLTLDLAFADVSGVDDVRLNLTQTGWPQGSLDGHTFRVTGIECVNHTLTGEAFDGDGNRTRFTVRVETYTVDRTPPAFDAAAATPAASFYRADPMAGGFRVEAKAGSTVDLVLSFSDAAGMGAVRKASGPGGTGTQSPTGSTTATLTVPGVVVSASAGTTARLTIEAQDALGNLATYAVDVVSTVQANNDTEGPTVKGVTGTANGQPRTTTWDTSGASVAPNAGDTALTVAVVFTDPSSVATVQKVSGPPTTTVATGADAPNERTYSYRQTEPGTVVLRATDGAGNSRDYAVERLPVSSSDTTAPAVVSVGATARRSGGSTTDTLAVVDRGADVWEVQYDPQVHDRLDLEAVFSDAGSGLKSGSVSPNVDWVWSPSENRLSAQWFWFDHAELTLTATDNADNQRRLTVRAVEASGSSGDTSGPQLTSASAETVQGQARTATVVSGSEVKVVYNGGDPDLDLTLGFTDASGLASADWDTPTDALVTVSGSTVLIESLGRSFATHLLNVTDTAGNTTAVRVVVEPSDTVSPSITRSLSATWTPGQSQTATGEASDAGGLSSFTFFMEGAEIEEIIATKVEEAYVNGAWTATPGNAAVTQRRIRLTGRATAAHAGRTYSATATAVDTSGNQTAHPFTITVPDVADEPRGLAWTTGEPYVIEADRGIYAWDEDFSWDQPEAGVPTRYEYQIHENPGDGWTPVQTTNARVVVETYDDNRSVRADGFRVRAVYGTTPSDWVSTGNAPA